MNSTTDGLPSNFSSPLLGTAQACIMISEHRPPCQAPIIFSATDLDRAFLTPTWSIILLLIRGRRSDHKECTERDWMRRSARPRSGSGDEATPKKTPARWRKNTVGRWPKQTLAVILVNFHPPSPSVHLLQPPQPSSSPPYGHLYVWLKMGAEAAAFCPLRTFTR